MSMIETFLGQILQAITSHQGSRIADLLVLNFDNLAPAQQKPYSDLHNELNQRYPPSNDAPLSTKVKKALPSEQLKATHSSFCEAIIQYFRYVRDFPNDSGLMKARKIERLTKQCIAALTTDQPGPTMIPIVLHLTTTLRQISINLDRDPDLLGLSSTQTDASTEDALAISHTEQTGNTLREAFIKIAQRTRPTVPPSPERLDSGLYLLLNSCMRIYAHIDKLRNTEQMLSHLDRCSPPLHYYPASQRVTYLYYLGLFFFTSNQFPRALQCLQESYDQCPKNAACVRQRRKILTHLLAASLCIGRLPCRVLLVDQAAHAISKPFAQLTQIIKRGDIGAFHTLTDYTLPGTLGDSARWLLRKRVLLQIRNRCEMLVWRSLIYHTFKHAGFLGSSESGKTNSMPYVRYSAISTAADFSYARAREAVFAQTEGAIDLGGGRGREGWDGYVDPDFEDGIYESDREWEEEHSNSNSQASGSENGGSTNGDGVGRKAAHPSLLDPMAEEINSVVLSLISQGFLRGFVSHQYPDLLQSRFAIPGVRGGRQSADGKSDLWKEVGFPSIFAVVREKEFALDEGDVPAWTTEEKVRKREQSAGAGRVVNLKGVRGVGEF